MCQLGEFRQDSAATRTSKKNLQNFCLNFEIAEFETVFFNLTGFEGDMNTLVKYLIKWQIIAQNIVSSPSIKIKQKINL